MVYPWQMDTCTTCSCGIFHSTAKPDQQRAVHTHRLACFTQVIYWLTGTEMIQVTYVWTGCESSFRMTAGDGLREGRVRF